jgi:hypothetical protein
LSWYTILRVAYIHLLWLSYDDFLVARRRHLGFQCQYLVSAGPGNCGSCGNPKLELVSEPISWNQNPTRIQGFYQLSFTISQVANMANWFDPFPSRLTRNPSANQRHRASSSLSGGDQAWFYT